MKKIFISGPYTKGDVAVNVKNAMEAADKIIEIGHIPYCPHLTHFLHINKRRSYETWLKIDFEFLKMCDYVLRIPGESEGAEKEAELAKSLKIPVFYSIEELKEKLS